MRTPLPLKRFWVVYGVIFLLFSLIIYQFVQLTCIRRQSLLKRANSQHIVRIDIPPLRGSITDRNGKEFVTNLKVPSIYAVPRIIPSDEVDTLAKEISKILGLEIDWAKERLKRDKAFVWLKRHVTIEEADKIKALKSSEFGIMEEYKRFYPQGTMLSQVLGFSNVDNEGLDGLERSLNGELCGKSGQRITQRDALGREIKAFEMKSLPAIDGNRIVLTIDQHLQYLTEKALEAAYKQWNAKGAWAIVLNPKTGEILAMANQPGFDPNYYAKATADSKRNRSVTDTYEPGSVFKIVAGSGALNDGVVTPDTNFNCEKGKWNYGVKTLRDVHPYGTIPMSEVMIKSSNIGTVKIALKMGSDKFQSYVQSFGFGKITGVDLPGEVSGFTRPVAQWSKTSPYNIPMGQEVTVTALQMVTAMSVIANDGVLMQPYIISEIRDASGVVIKKKKPITKRRVIKPEVAKTMRDILTEVVERGTGTRAKIENVSVGGKTGTAQKVLPNGKGYSHSNFMSSFIGFVPADNPQYAMVVVLDDPHPSYYGGTVAAPVFKEVMEAALLTQGFRARKNLSSASSSHSQEIISDEAAFAE